MYTVPMDVLLQMKEVRTYEGMLESGSLVEFEEQMGQAMFVSHQWLSIHHPDPDAEQLRTLQRALNNILSNASQVRLPAATEIYLGRVQCPTVHTFKAGRLFAWYDYCCCPQGASDDAARDRQEAIDSIPVYVARCRFFVILCPALRHSDLNFTLSQQTWSQRGWCRTERVAVELAEREDGWIIVIESATHQT
ncbi:ANKRD44, partial [Symbiodinium pilosum]